MALLPTPSKADRMTNSTAHKATALTGERLWLSTQLMLEAFHRAWAAGLDQREMAYVGTAWQEAAAYSLDAPCVLPAGACRSFEFDDDDLPAVVEQVVCGREDV
jgi:hypothetical protein